MSMGLSGQLGGNYPNYDAYMREQQYRNEQMARQMMGLNNYQQVQQHIAIETKPDVKLLLIGD